MSTQQKLWLPLIMSGLSAAGVLYMEMTRNDRTDVQRISVLESRQFDLTQRLDRIENKLDQLMDALLKK